MVRSVCELYAGSMSGARTISTNATSILHYCILEWIKIRKQSTRMLFDVLSTIPVDVSCDISKQLLRFFNAAIIGFD